MISVIIPTYNTNVFFLKKSIDSVLRQSFKDVEIVIVDSSDCVETINYLENLADANYNIKIFKSNKGVSIQRNIGIEQSKGDYIAFIDSDDYISQNYLELLYEKLEETGASIAYPQLIKEVFDNGVSTGFFPREITKTNEEVDEYNYFVSSCSSGLVNPVKLYKRSLIGDTRFDETLIHGEDMMFNYELSKKGFKAAYCPEAKYFFTGEIKANSARKRLSIESIRIIDTLYDLFKEKRKQYNTENLDGIYDQFSVLFKSYYYEAVKFNRYDLLNRLKKYKWLYIKKHHNFGEVMFVYFPHLRSFLRKLFRKGKAQ